MPDRGKNQERGAFEPLWKVGQRKAWLEGVVVPERLANEFKEIGQQDPDRLRDDYFSFGRSLLQYARTQLAELISRTAPILRQLDPEALATPVSPPSIPEADSLLPAPGPQLEAWDEAARWLDEVTRWPETWLENRESDIPIWFGYACLELTRLYLTQSDGARQLSVPEPRTFLESWALPPDWWASFAVAHAEQFEVHLTLVRHQAENRLSFLQRALSEVAARILEQMVWKGRSADTILDFVGLVGDSRRISSGKSGRPRSRLSEDADQLVRKMFGLPHVRDTSGERVRGQLALAESLGFLRQKHVPHPE